MSAYPRHYPGPSLLGASSSAWACGLVACSIPFRAERAPDGFPCSVCPFSVTTGRHCTPCPSYRVDALVTLKPGPNGDISLLGLPVRGVRPNAPTLAGSVQRRCAPTTLQAYLRLLPIVTRLGRSPLSASRLSPFRPCTPTFDDQSPPVGRCRLPSTWGAGVDPLVAGRTCMGIQLSKSRY